VAKHFILKIKCFFVTKCKTNLGGTAEQPSLNWDGFLYFIKIFGGLKKQVSLDDEEVEISEVIAMT